MNRNLFLHIVSKYDIVSFDIFDTLVKRRVFDPTELFYCAGHRCLSVEEAKQFRLDRIEAEKLARSQSSNKEVRIKEIYQILEKKYGKLSEELMDCEIQEEINQCTGIASNIELTKIANSSGKKVILVSDMYLPETVIKDILSNCKINAYEKLFLSNRYNAVKGDGSLFAIAINSLSIDPKRIIHFGDSIKADFLGAHKQGIDSVLIHRRGRFQRMLNKWIR